MAVKVYDTLKSATGKFPVVEASEVNIEITDEDGTKTTKTLQKAIEDGDILIGAIDNYTKDETDVLLEKKLDIEHDVLDEGKAAIVGSDGNIELRKLNGSDVSITVDGNSKTIQDSLNVASGIPVLDTNGKILATQLPTSARKIVGYIDAENVHTLPDASLYDAGSELIVTSNGTINQSTAFTLTSGKQLTEMEVANANLLIANGYVFTLSADSELGTVHTFDSDKVTLDDGTEIALPYASDLSATSTPAVVQINVAIGDELMMIDGHWVHLSNTSNVSSVNSKGGNVVLTGSDINVTIDGEQKSIQSAIENGDIGSGSDSWVGTQAKFDTCDKSQLKDGQEVIITDDYEASELATVEYVDDSLAVIKDELGELGGKEYIFNPSGIAVHSINHRGANDYAPENTMSAFRISKELGFDMVECDVDFTSDDIPVIIHDSTVDRTSDGSGDVHSFTFENIRKLDFGSWKSSAFSGEKIPSFDEFIYGCRTLGLHPYIEIKERDYIDINLVTVLVDIVKKYNMQDKVTWISFGIDKLQSVVKVDKFARVGFIEEFMSTDILDESVERIKTLDTGYNETFYNLNLGRVNSSIIDRLKIEKIKLEVWTVDSKSLVINADRYITGFTSNLLRADWILRDELFNDGDDLDYVNLTSLVQATEYVDTVTAVLAKRRNGYVYIKCYCTLGDVPSGQKYHNSNILFKGIPKKYIPYMDVSMSAVGWGTEDGKEVTKVCRVSVTSEKYMGESNAIRISESNMIKGDRLRAEWIYPVTYHKVN